MVTAKAIEEFEDDLQSRKPWEEKHAEWLKVYHQQDIAANAPWEGSSTESIPLLTEACSQFQNRAYKAFFPGRKFIGAVPVGVDKANKEEFTRAERVGNYMNTMLSIKDRNYKPDKNMMFLAAALHGSDFTKIFFDPKAARPKIERVRAQDLVVPYMVGPVNIEDVDRKTQIVFRSLHQATKLFEDGMFMVMPKTYEDDGIINSEITDVVNEAEGISKSNTSRYQQCQILEQHRFIKIGGIDIPAIVLVDYQGRQLLGVYPRYRENDPDKNPIEYFEHYKFFPNTDGFYGYGYGHLIGKINTAINKMLRQLIDAGELANTGNMGGFISEALGNKGGEIEVSLGKFVKIPRNVENLRNSIYQMQFPGPNSSYMQIMEFLQSVAQRVSSTTDAVTGDVQKVLQPLTIMTMLEQSLQLPTSVMEQMTNSLESELAKYYDCMKYNMTGNVQFAAPGENAQLVTVEDFQAETQIVPIIDPRNITSQQKLAKSQALYQFAMQNPLMAQNPNSLYEISKEVLEAMEVDDIDIILPQIPQPPPVQKIDEQELENMYFLLPPEDRPPFDVFPAQDHLDHLQKIDALLKMPDYASLIDEKSMIDLMMHRKKHMAYLYGVKEGVLKYVYDGKGGVGTMVEDGSNQGNVQGFGQQLQPPGMPSGMPTGQGGEISGANGNTYLSQAMGQGQAGEGILGLPSQQQH